MKECLFWYSRSVFEAREGMLALYMPPIEGIQYISKRMAAGGVEIGKKSNSLPSLLHFVGLCTDPLDIESYVKETRPK